jgi:xanthine dehydrogenase accessory factor
MSLVLVRGTGDVGSAVAHRLFRDGLAVVLHDEPQPTATRRGMAFTDAVLAGEAELAGVRARRVATVEECRALLASRAAIPVMVAGLETLLARLGPVVLVDARMRKRASPEVQRGWAPLTVGLGPNFIAGETVDLAVETQWGEELGRVIERGPTRPLEGEPRPILGAGRERFVYAPVAGVFSTTAAIGDLVSAGDPVGRIGDVAVLAPVTGMLRGLTPSGVPVTAGTKVLEVDPRGREAVVEGLGERPARIAEAVLGVVRAWQVGARPGASPRP